MFICVHLRFVNQYGKPAFQNWEAWFPTMRVTTIMKTNQAITNRNHPNAAQYALRREADAWEVTFGNRPATFKHELGALYVAYLLLHPSREPIHGVALALHARQRLGHSASPVEALQQRAMGLEDAASVRALWRHQRELERILRDRLEIEPVKAEAQCELEEITEHLRQSPWLSHHGAERCAQAVAVAIKRFHAHLAGAVDAEGNPDAVLRAFALHLHEYLLVPSGRGGAYARAQAVSQFAGCFIYQPPQGVVWEVQSPEAACGVRGLKAEVQGSRFKVQGSTVHLPAAVGYLSRFLCAGLVLALLGTGCVGPRPLKGGRAVTTRKPAGVIEQTVVQGENPSQVSKQTQETVKVRTYTLPAGSRIEQSPVGAVPAQDPSALSSYPLATPKRREGGSPLAAPKPGEGGSTFVLTAPMPVVEREETHARTELGAAQKDTARELGAKLSSLKGIVWVGVGLFVFGLASLVYPPLKVVIASVTTSAALMLGGLALMVLPSLIVGNELLILGGVGVAVGGWFLAHRHGQLRGIVAATAGNPGAGTADQKS